MIPFHNPALRQESQNKPPTSLTYVPRETLLEWLERTGKLKPSEVNEASDQQLPEDLDILEDSEDSK